jgi:hypothetical protein
MSCHAVPAWKGSPAWKRIGTAAPSIFLPSRHTGDTPTLVQLVCVGAYLDGACRIAGQAERHLSPGA